MGRHLPQQSRYRPKIFYSKMWPRGGNYLICVALCLGLPGTYTIWRWSCSSSLGKLRGKAIVLSFLPVCIWYEVDYLFLLCPCEVWGLGYASCTIRRYSIDKICVNLVSVNKMSSKGVRSKWRSINWLSQSHPVKGASGEISCKEGILPLIKGWQILVASFLCHMIKEGS